MSKKIQKLFIAYHLDKAIDDVTRIEVEYSDYQFTLSLLSGRAFNTEKEAEDFIVDTMNDYVQRGVDDKTRFVIIPTYVLEDDPNIEVK